MIIHTNPTRVSVASLNFVDMRKNTGPAVNEAEFNFWLLKKAQEAKVYTPFESQRLGHNSSDRIVAFGPHSLRAPLRLIRTQLALAKMLVEDLEHGGLLYYRHSRLAFAVALLQKKRPDVIVAMTRTHPSTSDTAIHTSPAKRFFAGLIDYFDTRLKTAIARKANWVDCVTEVQAIRLAKETRRPVEVVMNGVNTELFKPIAVKRRKEVRSQLGIPEGAIVVGYCGGFPEQRGAKEISALTAIAPDAFGVVIGKLSETDRANLAHDRILLLGEIDYQKVPDLVGAFDVAVALDVDGRPNVVGNSNQKVRQGLASGAWILTQSADLPFEDHPYLGLNAASRKAEYLAEIVRNAQQYFPMREARAAYARENLSTDSIFQARHDSILSGAKT